MNEMLRQVLTQTAGYAVAMFGGLFILGFLQRGFMLKFLIVRASLGRKILVRIQHLTHWGYAVGIWSEGDLIIGKKGDRKRISNVSTDDIYRSLGIAWVDLDGKKWCILPHVSTVAVSGHDPEKMESLITRAMYKPPLDDQQKLIKFVLVLVLMAILVAGVSAYLSYSGLQKIEGLVPLLNSLKQGLVVPTG